MTDFTQVFYTITAELNKIDLSTLFGDDVKVDQVKKVFGGKSVIFVRSVRYGRRLCLTEEIQGSNQDMVQTFNASGYKINVKQSFSKSTSVLTYKNSTVINGGSAANAVSVFGSSVSKNSDESAFDYCKRQIDATRLNVDKFIQAQTNVKLDGTKESDVNGVVLNYTAVKLDGVNPKDVTFWKSGEHKIKTLIPNTGLKVKVFNTSDKENILVSGYYTKFDSNGRELPDVYDIHSERDDKGKFAPGLFVKVGTVINQQVTLTKALRDGGPDNSPNWGRVHNKAFLTPEINLGKNVYRVVLIIRGRDGKKVVYGYNSNNPYILPCGEIMAGKLRKGKKGPETVNWYFGGYDDVWENDHGFT